MVPVLDHMVPWVKPFENYIDHVKTGVQQPQKLNKDEIKVKLLLKLSDTVWNCKQSFRMFGTEVLMLEIWRRSANGTQSLTIFMTTYTP